MDAMVSREYTVHAVSNVKDLHWDYNSPRPHAAHGATRLRRVGNHGRKGPASLVDTAAQVAADNLEKFSLDYLDTIHPHLIIRVWDEFAGLDGSISLHAWKAFNTASQKMAHHDKARRYRHDSSLTMRRFFHHISLPAADFSCYLQPLQSTGTFHFISHIRIAGACHIKSQDLLLLSGLKNLGVLEIIEPSDEVQPFPRVSDRLVRTWSEEKDAFPKLSILRVCSYHDLTEHSLQYVTKLPALALFEVRGGLQDWQQSERCAAEQGWIACDRSRVRTRPYPPHHQTTNPKSSCLQLTRQVDRPRFLGLDAHYWACWAYESIQTKPLNVCSEDNVGAMSAWESDACRLNVPFASLSLGLDHPYTVERPARSMYDVKMIFFWRQSLFDTDDAPQASTEAPPRMPPLKRNARKAAPERPQSTSQYVKRRRKSNLVDLLEGFQG